MPYRRKEFVAGHYYHIYNRGCNYEPIFSTHDNYIYLLQKVKRLLREIPLVIIAYCLMPNHYHSVIRQKGNTPISTFIQRLFLIYTQAYNKQQGRRGPLFEGRFKCIHIDSDEYVIHLCRYVHLNPVVAGLVSRPEDWPYSNYREWIGLRAGTLVDHDFVQTFFRTPEEYVAFAESQIDPQLEQKLRLYYLE